MKRKITSVGLIIAGSLLALASIAFGSHGTKEQKCRAYAQSAVKDYESMIGTKKCRVHDSPRWQANYKNHYGWCMSVSDSARIAESKARDAHLLHCGARSTL